jgi:hypothetical protein
MPNFDQARIREITQELEMGFRCFFHKETGELLSFPDEFKYPGQDLDAWAEDIEKFETDPFSSTEVEPIHSDDSFQIMADFAEQLRGDVRLQDRLVNALNRKHPFRNFKFIIDNSGKYREQWFEYKDARLMQLVKDRVERDS